MQDRNKKAIRRWTTQPLIVVLAGAAGSGAWADEPSPYYIGVAQSLTRDTNVYGSTTPVSDNYSSTGLKAGLDQTIGRQRVYGDATVHYNKYQSETALNNTSYGVAAGWNWATINELSGTFAATANQSLASQDTTTGAQQNANGEKNVVKTDQLSTSVAWGGVGTFGLQGAYSHSRVNYTAASYLALDSSANSASLGVLYRLGPEIRLGTAVRYVRTESPNGYTPSTGPSESNTANIRNLDLTADWHVTAQSGIDARLSWTRQANTNPNLSDLDFSGLTGIVSARYAPTGKTSLTASFSRDVGANASLFNNPNATVPASGQSTSSNLTHNSQTTDTLALGVNYAATAKIGVNLGGSYRRSKIVYNGSTATDSYDKIGSASLGADYAVARNWQLGCKAAHALRSVSGSGSYSYTDDSVSCTVQLTLR